MQLCTEEERQKVNINWEKFRIIEAKMSGVGMVFDRDVSEPHLAVYANEY